MWRRRHVEPPGEPEPEPVALTVVPDPEPEPEPDPEPEPELEPAAAGEAVDETVVALPVAQEPRRWNVWDLERLSRASAGIDASQDDERTYLLLYMREFADPDGMLPVDFDPLVRETFGELVTVL